jgi:hypothetical protein
LIVLILELQTQRNRILGSARHARTEPGGNDHTGPDIGFVRPDDHGEPVLFGERLESSTFNPRTSLRGLFTPFLKFVFIGENLREPFVMLPDMFNDLDTDEPSLDLRSFLSDLGRFFGSSRAGATVKAISLTSHIPKRPTFANGIIRIRGRVEGLGRAELGFFGSLTSRIRRRRVRDRGGHRLRRTGLSTGRPGSVTSGTLLIISVHLIRSILGGGERTRGNWGFGGNCPMGVTTRPTSSSLILLGLT